MDKRRLLLLLPNGDFYCNFWHSPDIKIEEMEGYEFMKNVVCIVRFKWKI